MKLWKAFCAVITLCKRYVVESRDKRQKWKNATRKISRRNFNSWKKDFTKADKRISFDSLSAAVEY